MAHEGGMHFFATNDGPHREVRKMRPTEVVAMCGENKSYAYSRFISRIYRRSFN